MDEQSATLATTATGSDPRAAALAAIRAFDAEISAVKSRLEKLELAGRTDWTAVKQWFAARWPHFVTWIGLAASSPLLGMIRKVLSAI
jgi:hypothetical protein